MKPEAMESDEDEENDLWEEGYFAESMSRSEMEEKVKTLHKKNNEDMNFNCKKCRKKISAHNKDWHDGMCDACFNKTYFKADAEENGKHGEDGKENN